MPIIPRAWESRADNDPGYAIATALMYLAQTVEQVSSRVEEIADSVSTHASNVADTADHISRVAKSIEFLATHIGDRLVSLTDVFESKD